MMIPGGRHYKATFSAIAVTAAQDLFEIVAASGKPCWLIGLEIGQYTDAGDAQDELLSLLFIRDYSTSGSGGAAVTPTPQTGDTAFSGTVERNNTTVASGGTPLTMYATSWNVRAGYIWQPDPMKWIYIPSAGRLVVTQTVPADSITMNGTALFIEVG